MKPQLENHIASWNLWEKIASARTGSVSSSLASGEQYMLPYSRIAVENNSMIISEEKNALNNSEITSAWIDSRNKKPSMNRPYSDPQKTALRRTTRASRSRAPDSIDRSVSHAIVDRSLDNTRDSASAGIKRLGPQCVPRPVVLHHAVPLMASPAWRS